MNYLDEGSKIQALPQKDKDLLDVVLKLYENKEENVNE